MKTRIEICGGIAAGKSTLTKILEKNGYAAVYERFEDNPFIKQFYQNADQDNTFETEIVFTLLHYNQIKQKQQEDLLVSDYSLLQDYCYGIQNLQEAEKTVFNSMYDYLLSTLSPVNLIIYLKCGVDCLLHRISERNREMEMTISKEYLQDNIKVIESQLSKEKKVLQIDSEKYDFRNDCQREIIDLIEEAVLST